MKNAKYLVAIAAFVALALIGFSAFTTVPEKAAEALPIQNGTAQREAIRNEFPFLTVITTSDYKRGYGILISPEWVLTTAQLVHGATGADLVFGVHNFNAYSMENGVETSAVKVHITGGGNNVSMHENWSPNSPYNNNLALIRVPPLTLSSAIQPISDLNVTQNWVGQAAKGIGWGLYNNNNAQGHTATPQVADVSMVAMQEAINTLGYAFNPASNLAASGQGATCATTVLVTTGADGTQLVGLLNEGLLDGSMTVFTRLDHFVDWVMQNSGVYLN